MIAQVKDKKAVAQLEHEAQRQKTIHTALARFKQNARIYVHEPKKACYLDIKDPNLLRNFKTGSGARGTLENITELRFMEGNLRRAFATFIMNAASIKLADAYPPTTTSSPCPTASWRLLNQSRMSLRRSAPGPTPGAGAGRGTAGGTTTAIGRRRT